MSWEFVAGKIKTIEVVSNNENELVTVKGIPDRFQCIGVGTDAAVVRSVDAPDYAFKVYSNDKLEKLEVEKQVYEKLGQSDFFPNYYGSGSTNLVLSFEKGLTLYDCLLKGIHIPKQAIEDVDKAIVYALSRGLNPRDIHLKNILLHEGRAKLLDVSEYLKQGNDCRWDYLKQGYQENYHVIDGKVVPFWIVETVRKWYNQTQPDTFNFPDFVRKLTKLFRVGA
ncbi:serine/threonine protein kinase [Halalkalibacter kiskunsagensis]|uniref:Serine/threonine protein kinase n=1 Tax=Halalkalibacter kiskunsagensis TaxID=1548599 RepID=A0ABV6KHD3_9BACI